MSVEKKINKIVSIIDNEIHPESTVKSKYNFNFLININEVCVNFYKDFIDAINIDDIEKIIADLKLIQMIREAEDGKTILVSKNGAHYWNG